MSLPEPGRKPKTIGRPRNTEIGRKFTARLYGQDVEEFNELIDRHKSNGDALKYLLGLVKERKEQQTNREEKDERVARNFYEAEAAQLEQKDLTKLYLPLSKETWKRYSTLCQKACPLWTRKGHNERIAMILKMAEKYYTWSTSQANSVASLRGNDQRKAAVYDLQSTPPRATLAKDMRPPTTPAKTAIYPKTLERTPRQDEAGTTEKEVRQQINRNLQSSSELEKYFDTAAQADHDAASVAIVTGQRQSTQPRVLGVTVDQSQQNNLIIFFQADDIQHQRTAAPSTPQGANNHQPGPEKAHLEQSDDINSRQDCLSEKVCDARRMLPMPLERIPGSPTSEGGGVLQSLYPPSFHVSSSTAYDQSQICGGRHPTATPTRATEPLRSIEFTMPPTFYRKFIDFFKRHGWGPKSAVEKLRILMEIVNRRLEITSKQDISSRRAVIDTAISNLEVGSDEEESAVEHGFISGSPTIKILVNHRLSRRYDNFFTISQYNSSQNSERFKVLLGLAELYVDLGLSDEGLDDSYYLKDSSISGASVGTTGDKPEIAPFVLWLSPEAKKRFTEFFKRLNKGSESDDTKIITLLNLTELDTSMNPGTTIKGSNSSVGNCTTSKKTEIRKDIRNRSSKKRTVVSLSDDDDDDGDSDGTWDDGTKSAKRHGEAEQSLGSSASANIEPKSGENTAIRLLKPDYFLNFSQEARVTRPSGSKRSVAALANTRRHIVERRKLKQLIAQCACVQDQCSQKIDRKSIKIKERLWVILVDAHCSDEAKHKFSWASSQKIVHFNNKKSQLYTLNMAASAAVQTLRLTWGHCKMSAARLLQVARPVARQCFEMTQEEMLNALKEESKSGQIVLAGDGQFDSPGSCATTCTYTLMALGKDETKEDGSHQLRKCGYVISQAVIDRRHAENKPVNMERVGLHWALQPIIKAGIKVAELVTDDHIQIVSDFRKIAAAAEEQKANAATDDDEDAALTTFQHSLSTALQHFHPTVNLDAEIGSLLSFYSAIIHSNDIWHRAKNLLKSVSSIAQTASSKEQQCYRKYAKMLRNYLWECAEAAKGCEEKFLELWTAVTDHLHDNHTSCDATNLHSKTKLMGKLDQTTRPFARLIACMRRVKAAAPQLCRFRNTGNLESYNGLTLKYCPKRIVLSYDSMVMRRDLAALDHNHHVLREIKRKKDGQVASYNRWRKSTKASSRVFYKEEKDYEYIGHVMAAILLERCQTDQAEGDITISAAHPWRIHRSLELATQHQMRQLTGKQQAKCTGGKTQSKSKTPAKKRPKKQRESSSSNASTPSSSDSDDDKWQSDGSGDDDEGIRTKKPNKRKAVSSDDVASPNVGEGASKRSRQTVVSPRTGEPSGTKLLAGSMEGQEAGNETPQDPVSSRACQEVDQDSDELSVCL